MENVCTLRKPNITTIVSCVIAIKTQQPNNTFNKNNNDNNNNNQVTTATFFTIEQGAYVMKIENKPVGLNMYRNQF